MSDPLSGTVHPGRVGPLTYHLQELAFLSWCYHQAPSIAVNGWFSDQDTFRSPAAAYTS